MLNVILGTIPGALTLFYFFGWGVVFNLLVCASTALISEAAIFKLRDRNVLSGLTDFSALLTAVLLALALPPLAPWWVAVIGTLFAIVFAKHLYGGLGFNPFNPAMAGYVLLLISFPVAMTGWLPPKPIALHHPDFSDSLALFLTGSDTVGNPLRHYLVGVDGFTMATPLDQLKTGINSGFMLDEILAKPVFDDWQNVGWQWVNLGFLLGGIYLLILGVIRWHIPVAMLTTVFVVSGLLHSYDPARFASPMFHLLSGASMLGAFFIATDPVSASTTEKGRIIFGAGIGLILVMIRSFGGYPDAVAFAVLLMNITAPLIDHYTQPKVYGAGNERHQE
jgi:electron transport complex protein RnfD